MVTYSRKLFCLSSTLAVILGLAVWGSFRGIEARELADQVYDAGEVDAETVIKHEFVLFNSTGSDVQVTNVQSSCSCTVAKVPKVMRAGTACSIPVEVRIRDIEELFESRVRIQTQSGREVALVVHAKVRRELPKVVEFRDIKRGEAPDKTFVFRPTRGGVRVKAVRAEPSLIGVDFFPDPHNVSYTVFKVRASPNLSAGQFRTKIFIQPEGPEPEREVAVEGRVLGPIEAEPSTLLFAGRSPGDTVTADLRLVSPYGDEAELLGVRCDPSEILSCDITAVTHTAHSLQVPFRAVVPYGEGVAKGTVIVSAKTRSSRETCELRLPVYILQAVHQADAGRTGHVVAASGSGG